MTFLLFQAFLLMVAAYFIGAFVGCWWRRAFVATADSRGLRSSYEGMTGAATAGAVAAGTSIGVPRSQPIPVQPRIEYVETPDSLSDTTRFERALSGVGGLSDEQRDVSDVEKPTFQTEESSEFQAERSRDDNYAAPVDFAPGADPLEGAGPVEEDPVPGEARYGETGYGETSEPEDGQEPVPESDAVGERDAGYEPAPVLENEPGPGPARRETDDAVAAAAAAAAAVVISAHRSASATTTHEPEDRIAREPYARDATDDAAPSVDAPLQSPVAASGGMAGVSADVRTPALMPADRQDLKLVRGIDAETERILNGIGVWRYNEIARWWRGDVDAVNHALGDPARVERENWIEQATLLAGGTLSDYARRVLRGERVGASPTAVAQPPRGPAPNHNAPAAATQSAQYARSWSSSPSMMANAGAIAIAAASASASRGQAASDLRVVRAPRPKITPIGEPTEPPQNSETEAQSSIVAPSDAPAETAAVQAQETAVPPELAGELPTLDTGEAAPTQTDQTDLQSDAVHAEAADSIADGTASTQHEEQGAALPQAQLAQAEPITPEELEPPATRPARLVDAMRENHNFETTVPPDEPTFEDTTQAEDSSPASPDEQASEAERPRKDVSGLRSVRSAGLRSSPDLGGPSDVVDDLKRIRGVGVLIEKKLNSLGISAYEQIANWTADDIAHVSEVLDFRGRIERENWVEQARILTAGGQTEFSRRVDRGEPS